MRTKMKTKIDIIFESMFFFNDSEQMVPSRYLDIHTGRDFFFLAKVKRKIVENPSKDLY